LENNFKEQIQLPFKIMRVKLFLYPRSASCFTLKRIPVGEV